MPLIQRSFFYQNFEFHLSYSLGKFLLTAKNSKIFGNVRDLRISPSWSWYFVRYHQSSPLLLHVLSQVMDLATVNCSEQGQDYSSQEITHNLIILGHGRVRRRQKNLPSLEQGSTMDRNVPEMGTLHHLTIICGHSRMRNGTLSEGRWWQKSEWVFQERTRTKWTEQNEKFLLGLMSETRKGQVPC